ncbi:MAG TPA: hypothetical protein RMH99_02520 [Sandaracinaceae bacterium LLY-WYZ-13_1]|nr:hypothetical protein [Sandaracinaceae bacterium LLY-WYZ-13_1]
MIATPARPTQGQRAATLEDLEGRYSFVGGAREERRLRGAIDEVVDRMNLFVREIARGEIRRNVTADRRIEIDVVDDRTVRFRFDDWGPVRARVDGRSRQVRGPDGSDTRLTARFGGGRLYLQQVSSRGTRDNWLSLASDRERVTLQVRIRADQLPAPIEYALTYRRR